MKIVVAIKEVPSRDSVLRVDDSGRWIDTSRLSYEINEPDAYALEAALALRDQTSGEVVAVTVGPARASQSIREALAKGADRAIHVVEDASAWDSLSLARLLAAALEPEKPEVVLTGLQSDDLGYGQAGVVLAELMGFAHATIVMGIEPEEGRLKVKRELEDGWFQYVRIPTPAVLTIQSGSYKLRYATLMGIKKARTKEVRQVTAAELGVAPEPSLVIGQVSTPEKTKHTQLFEGDPKKAAASLLEKLRFEARVL
jgi:electron transfer flavoprotein beta subunit